MGPGPPLPPLAMGFHCCHSPNSTHSQWGQALRHSPNSPVTSGPLAGIYERRHKWRNSSHEVINIYVYNYKKFTNKRFCKNCVFIVRFFKKRFFKNCVILSKINYTPYICPCPPLTGRLRRTSLGPASREHGRVLPAMLLSAWTFFGPGKFARQHIYLRDVPLVATTST